MSIYYFGIPEKERSTKQFNKNGDGVVDIIIPALSIILCFYLIVDKIIKYISGIKGNFLSINKNIVKIQKNSEVMNLNPSKSNVKN